MTASDIHSLFEARAHLKDFVNASKVEETIGLALSGGGYRAMLYHAGAMAQINNAGLLGRLAEVASVSGGSIAAGVLASRWGKLDFDESGRARNFDEEVTQVLVRFAKVRVDVRAGLMGLLPGRTAGDEVAAAYDRHLFGGVTLQDLPDRPRFTFMTTNLESGSAFRFAKDYAADHRVGRIDHPNFPLAKVVAASSAFPPFLSPVRIPFEAGSVTPLSDADLHRSPFTDRAVLTDGGVYDNLGLERIWRRCRTVLVSNAGLTVPQIGPNSGRWVGQLFRVIGLLQHQADSARRRILFGMANLGQRKVAYWSIDEGPKRYGGTVDDALFTESDTIRTANMRIRLNRHTDEEIDLLLRAGRAGAAAALGTHFVS